MAKLKDITGPVNLLTVNCTNAWLERKNDEPTFFAEITDDLEVNTTSKERRRRSTSDWLKNQIGLWEEGARRIMVASPEHPLEVVTGDVTLVLKCDLDKYLIAFLRDIPPVGLLTPGGCPDSLPELLEPRLTSIKECCQEVLIMDKTGIAYHFSPYLSACEKILADWKITPTAFIPLFPSELPAEGGHAHRLVIRYKGREYTTENVNLTVSTEEGTVSSSLFWKVELPFPFRELHLFDGETLANGPPLNRAIWVMDQNKIVRGVFSRGLNALAIGWHWPETDPKRAFIP